VTGVEPSADFGEINNAASFDIEVQLAHDRPVLKTGDR
jgi:hypothetical protein